MKEARNVIPFRGLLYAAATIGDLGRVMAPPYDVISPEYQARLYERHPHNVIRLILGKETTSDTPQDNRYVRAAKDLQDWTRQGVLIRDEQPAIYLYEQKFRQDDAWRQRRGFIALRRLEEFGEKIRPHEQTLSHAKADRLQLLRACQANLSPIFSIYSDPSVPELLSPRYQGQPALEFTDDDAGIHRLWRCTDPQLIDTISAKMDQTKLLIADGHHRYETALAYRNEMHSRTPGADPSSPFHYVMMFFAESADPGLQILPTHRLVLKPKFSSWPTVLSELKSRFEVQAFSPPERARFLQSLVALTGKGRAFGVAAHQDPPFLLVSQRGDAELEVLTVHNFLLRQLFKLPAEAEKNPSEVEYIRDSDELMKRLAEDRTRIAILLNPISPADLARTVETGTILPPKTTFFYPKLWSGLVIHPLKTK